jgi:hypothetical protein
MPSCATPMKNKRKTIDGISAIIEIDAYNLLILFGIVIFEINEMIRSG